MVSHLRVRQKAMLHTGFAEGLRQLLHVGVKGCPGNQHESVTGTDATLELGNAVHRQIPPPRLGVTIERAHTPLVWH